MRRIVLFGGSGFIGTHALSRLDEAGFDVIAIGRAQIDLLNATPDSIENLIRASAADVVVNCTGRLDGTALELVDAHTRVTAALLDAVSLVPGVKLVRIGSAGEYGDVPFGGSVAENDPTRPVSAYGVSHLAATELVRTATQHTAVDAVTLRVFNPIGPGSSGNSLLVRAAELIHHAQRTGQSQITLGSLGAWRDFVDVRDVARAIVLAAGSSSEDAGALSPIINIGSGRAHQARHLISELVTISGFDGEVVEEGDGPARSAGVLWTQADISLAARLLGWKPELSLADSARGVWQAVCRNAEVAQARLGQP